MQQDFTADTRVAADLLARAHVAAYPIDAREVFTNPAMKVDTSQSSLTNPFSNGMPSRNGDPTAVPNAFAQSEVKMEKQMDESTVRWTRWRTRPAARHSMEPMG